MRKSIQYNGQREKGRRELQGMGGQRGAPQSGAGNQRKSRDGIIRGKFGKNQRVVSTTRANLELRNTGEKSPNER